MLDRREKYETAVYGSARDCLRQTYKLQGVRGLYQGLGLSVLQNAVMLVGVKNVYEILGERVEAKYGYLQLVGSCLIVDMLLYPIDTLK